VTQSCYNSLESLSPLKEEGNETMESVLGDLTVGQFKAYRQRVNYWLSSGLSAEEAKRKALRRIETNMDLWIQGMPKSEKPAQSQNLPDSTETCPNLSDKNMTSFQPLRSTVMSWNLADPINR
jgi:hypothetical protein